MSKSLKSARDFHMKILIELNPHTPVPQKIADEVFFDVSKVKESSFFKSDLTDPPSDF